MTEENSDPLESDVDLPETLYHYTDINGVQGIWESGTIWATNSMFLNDTTELRLGAAMIKTALAERELKLLKECVEFRESKAGDETSSQQIEASDRELAQLKDIRSALDYVQSLDVYITCLTEKGDQLSQWRGYAREGYCVGLNANQLLAGLADNDDLVIRRVRYGDAPDSEEYVARSIQLAKAWRSVILESDEIDDSARHFVMGKYMMLDAAFVKDSGFAEEKEVRIAQTHVSTPDLFTPHRYGMVPRRRICIPAGAITSVRVGPSAHEELKMTSLRSYFTATGFAGQPLPDDPDGTLRLRPRVFRSSIPFRDW